MAPPRKSSTQSRNARKPVDEEVDEDTHTDSMDVEDDAEDDEFDASQGTAFQKAIVQGLHDQKKRHAINRKKVKEGYSETKGKLHDNIVNLFDKLEDQSDTVHRAQLTRLADLLALKASLEAQMTSKLASLRASYDQHSKELTSVLGSRIKELK